MTDFLTGGALCSLTAKASPVFSPLYRGLHLINGGANLSSEFWLTEGPSQLFELTRSPSFWGNSFCAFSMSLCIPFFSPLSLYPGKVRDHPSHRNFPISGLWSDHFPFGTLARSSLRKNCVSLGTVLKSPLLLHEAFLASPYSDHSLTRQLRIWTESHQYPSSVTDL